MQSVNFQLVVNLKTSKVLGLAIPPSLLACADEANRLAAAAHKSGSGTKRTCRRSRCMSGVGDQRSAPPRFMPAIRCCRFERVLRLSMGAPMAGKTGSAADVYPWYVTFERGSEWRPCSSRAPSPRKTKSFQNEIEAKRFAKSKLSEGFSVTAGTLNPHRPKRRIAASEIDQWLDEISVSAKNGRAVHP